MATLLNSLVGVSGTDFDSNSQTVGSSQYIQQQKFYVLTLIKRCLPYLPMWEDAQKVSIPDHSGGFGATNGVINLRKFNALAVSTTALSEGIVPDGLNPTQAVVTVSLAQYGDWIKISDVLASASIDDIMKEYQDVLAENAGQKLHKIIINSLTGADVTQTVYGGSVTAFGNLTASDVLTSTVVKKAVRTLRNANVQPYPDGYYRGIIHPYQEYDLMNDSLWQDVAKYGGGMGNGGGLNLIAGEIGRIHGVRFRSSTEVLTDTAGSGSAITYHALVYGPNAFGIFDLKSQAVSSINTETNKGMNIHVYPINEPSPSDPMGQFGFVSWKAAFASKLIDPLRLVRMRTGATQ